MVYGHRPCSIRNQQYGSQTSMTNKQDLDLALIDERDTHSHRDKLRRCRPGQVQELADHQSLAEKHPTLSWSKRSPDLESVEVEPSQAQLLMAPDCSYRLGLR